MSETGYKIDQYLFDALHNIQSSSFTAGQLNDAFCQELGICSDLKNNKIKKWIYRQLARLVKFGLLERRKAKNPRMTSYRKLAGFVEKKFNFSPGPFLKSISEAQSTTDVMGSGDLHSSSYESAIGELKNRAKQCHVDLLSSVGESEEYKALFKTYPSLRKALQPRYQQALESSSKLLGQLRAIEAALEHYQISES